MCVLNVLENTPDNCQYIESLPKVYLVVLLGCRCVREFPFTGRYKYSNDTNKFLPVVYEYCCENGLDVWEQKTIDSIKSGWYIGYSFDKNEAEQIANKQ